MKLFTLEDFYNDAKSILVNNLATKIEEINTAKGDSLLIVPDDENFYDDFTDGAISHDLIVHYTLIGADSVQNNGPHSAIEATFMAFVMFSDPNSNESSVVKGLRYVQALMEIYQENFAKNPHISDYELGAVMPQSIRFDNSDEWYKMGGIEIKGTFAA